ncbi:MAG: hypothetical protein IPL32_17665 [Chloracidobacterium sp.]|nr:hypothetical protein [Chloracidobacterium sp.]
MSNALFAAIAALIATTGEKVQDFVPRFSFNHGTPSRRVRSAGKRGQAGDKMARHADEQRLGTCHGISYPMKVTPRMARAAKKRMSLQS